MGRWGDGEMGRRGRWGGGQMRDKVILLSPHLPIPLSPHPLSMPNAHLQDRGAIGGETRRLWL
jgi:hypothetical protein